MVVKKSKCKFNENDADEILPGLWLGNMYAAKNINFLKQNNIKNIINVTKVIPNYFVNSDIKYVRIPIRDKEICDKNLINIFNISGKYIYKKLKNKENILVHCKWGHQRSACIVAAFIIKYLKIDILDTLKFIKYKRKCTFYRKTCILKNMVSIYLQ
jgi:protein-tyrosine phosphatase